MTKIFCRGYTDGTSNYLKANPAWVRTVFLDPETLTPVKDGETGVIAITTLPIGIHASVF